MSHLGQLSIFYTYYTNLTYMYLTLIKFLSRYRKLYVIFVYKCINNCYNIPSFFQTSHEIVKMFGHGTIYINTIIYYVYYIYYINV